VPIPIEIFQKQVPNFYYPYFIGINQVNQLVKSNYSQYLTCFREKKEINFTKDDRTIVFKQLNRLKQKLKDSIIKDMNIPDTLYNCLKKYGNKQFLITDVLEFYTAEYVLQSGHNIYWLHRFFIFDLTSKQLSFYTYLVNNSRILGEPANNLISEVEGEGCKSCYVFFRKSEYKMNIKKYNRKIRGGYIRGLREQKHK
jgi:hypothetical protein